MARPQSVLSLEVLLYWKGYLGILLAEFSSIVCITPIVLCILLRFYLSMLLYFFLSVGKPSGYDRVRNAEIGNKVR